MQVELKLDHNLPDVALRFQMRQRSFGFLELEHLVDDRASDLGVRLHHSQHILEPGGEYIYYIPGSDWIMTDILVHRAHVHAADLEAPEDDAEDHVGGERFRLRDIR